MRTEINTSQFEMAHGRSPKGRGSWAFHPNANVDSSSKEIFWFTGLYGDARRAAVNHFTAKGCDMVYVLT